MINHLVQLHISLPLTAMFVILVVIFGLGLVGLGFFRSGENFGRARPVVWSGLGFFGRVGFIGSGGL
jgi:hypothetical protein